VRVLAFTKSFGSVPVDRLADAVAATGADGADLVVRHNQTVAPDEPAGIGAVAAALRRRGLSLPVVTTDLLTADAAALGVLTACADAGVELVRAGFYRYDPAQGYARCLDAARRGLASLADEARRCGVRMVLQIHHETIHPSAALALAVVRDLDVGVYADPGNQAKEGTEAWALHLDLLGDRLACSGVKNAQWVRGADGRWAPQWCPLADGVVPWPDLLPELAERLPAGPLSVHAHHPAPDPVAAVGADVAHLRSMLG
jgi:sugar phosphate isomerase/epimerase